MKKALSTEVWATWGEVVLMSYLWSSANEIVESVQSLDKWITLVIRIGDFLPLS